MTQEQKDILTAKMVSLPDQLTDEDIDAILRDEELLELYSTAVMVKSASQKAREYDVDKEWEAFQGRLAPRRTPAKRRLWIIRAAAVIVVALLAGAAVLNTLRTSDSPTASPHTVITKADSDTIEPPAVHEPPTPLIAAIDKGAPDPQTPPKTKAPKVRKTKKTTVHQPEAQPETPAPQTVSQEEIQQQLAIQQARIDNRIAQNLADVYMAEYYAIQRANPQNTDNSYTRVNYNTAQPRQGGFMRMVME